MRLPARSFGDLTNLRLTVMKPCRKTRDGNTGSATISRCPNACRLITSELDISQASNSRLRPMRSKIVRGSSIARNFRSMPSGFTSPV